MNKKQYRALRESIRINGLRATTYWAMQRQDLVALGAIDQWVNQCMKPTDWLTVRARWIKTERDAIRLTTWITL